MAERRYCDSIPGSSESTSLDDPDQELLDLSIVPLFRHLAQVGAPSV